MVASMRSRNGAKAKKAQGRRLLQSMVDHEPQRCLDTPERVRSALHKLTGANCFNKTRFETEFTFENDSVVWSYASMNTPDELVLKIWCHIEEALSETVGPISRPEAARRSAYRLSLVRLLAALRDQRKLVQEATDAGAKELADR